MQITNEDVLRIIESKEFTKEQKQKYLYYLFSFPENFFVYCKTVLPHAFTKPSAEFHKEIITDFMKKGNSALAAPRGFAKSSIIGLGYITWLIAYRKEKYIIYISQNHTKSVQFIEPLNYETKHNPMFKFIYGNINIKRLEDDVNLSDLDRQDIFDINGVRIQALSFEKNIRGLKYNTYRPTLILCDDIEDDARVINPDLRVKDGNKLNKQIIPSLDVDNGRFKMIGTILHHDSLLVQKIRNLNGKIYKAIDENGKLLWPEMFTKEKLDDIRKNIGHAAFQSEYLNTPVDDTFSLIKREWIKSCCDESLSYYSKDKFDYKVMGVDFAFSDRITADKSAFVIIGKKDDYYVVIDCLTKQGMSITEQFDYIEYLSGTNNINDNALEENSIRSMSKELKNYNFPYTLFWTGANDAPYREQTDAEFKNKRHTIGKSSMIKRLATQFENKRIKLPYMTEKDKLISNSIIDECSTYALQDGKLIEIGVHGDIPIALGYAIERIEMEKIEFEFGMIDMAPETMED